jgi:S-adenosylmethionine hydrolase
MIIDQRNMILAALLLAVVSNCAHLKITEVSGSEPSGYLAAKVVRISEEYANINTDVSEKALRNWGIADKEQFTVKYKNHLFSVLSGQGYSDVAKGEWVGLIEDDGMLQLAISFGNAATQIGCAVGDTLYIEEPGGGE